MERKLKIDKNYLIFLGVYIFVFFPLAIFRFPDIKNEIKYFVIVDNMIQSKNLFILKYLGELYPDKPPLYFFILFLARKYMKDFFIQGTIILGSLIPSFFITTYFYKFIKRFKSEREAFIFTIFLISIPFFIGTSAFIRMDMLMSCFIFLSLYFFFNLYYGKIKFNNINIFAIYIFIFLAIFTKGPAGFGIPVGIILVFLMFEKNIGFLKKIKFFRGILLILCFLGIWIGKLFTYPEGKEYVNLLFGQETVGRIVKSKAHVRPFYYYIKKLPAILYPYGITILFSIVYYLKNIKSYNKWDILEKIGFVWTIVVIVLLSIASGKLEIYLLPISPGAILLLLSFIMKLRDKKIGKILLIVMEVLSILSIPFNLIFNKEKNFYKRLLITPISLFIIFVFINFNIEFYNKNYTLKYPIKIINKDVRNQIISYRFEDIVNLKDVINKEIIITDNFGENISIDKKIFISKTKYIDDLKDKNLNIIYKNKKYFIFEF